MKFRFLSSMLFGILVCAGCNQFGGDTDKNDGHDDNDGHNHSSTAPQQEDFPVFTAKTSEYPSWSTLLVACKQGLINPAKGQTGELEKKWKVDVVLDAVDYDSCITAYGNGACDAVFMTNMDSLNPALTRPSTIVAPTSTSVGGDQVIAIGIDDVDGLKGKKVYGLAKSVSEYTFRRGLEKLGKNPSDFEFANQDPGVATTALQNSTGDTQAICVWNPFALTVTSNNKNAKVLFSSELIPEEILDCLVVANSSLKKNGGEEGTCCLLDAFYRVCKSIDDPATKRETTVALGEDFSDLNFEQMQKVLKETQFYSTPQDGIELFKSDRLPILMEQVVKTCKDIEVLEGKTPSVGYGDSSTQLNFDPQFMEKVSKSN